MEFEAATVDAVLLGDGRLQEHRWVVAFAHLSLQRKETAHRCLAFPLHESVLGEGHASVAVPAVRFDLPPAC